MCSSLGLAVKRQRKKEVYHLGPLGPAAELVALGSTQHDLLHRRRALRSHPLWERLMLGGPTVNLTAKGICQSAANRGFNYTSGSIGVMPRCR